MQVSNEDLVDLMEHAAQTGNLELVVTIIENIDYDNRRDIMEVGVIWAARMGHADILNYMLKQDFTLANDLDVMRNAIVGNHVDCVQILWRAEPLFDLDIMFGLAVKCGHWPMVQQIAEFDTKNTIDYYSVISAAVDRNDIQALEYFAMQNVKFACYRELGRAISKKQPEITKYLLRMGDYSAADMTEAWKKAIRTGCALIVQYLHEAGMMLNAYDNYAIRIAACFGHMDLTRYLVRSGADTTAVNLESVAKLEIVIYLQQQQYLQSQSQLRQLATICYCRHYQLIPDPETIPESIYLILQAGFAR